MKKPQTPALFKAASAKPGKAVKMAKPSMPPMGKSGKPAMPGKPMAFKKGGMVKGKC